MKGRRKPQGWPDYMLAKKLSGGRTGYYWNPPSWARKGGCPMKAEALGADYGAAKQRCDVLLNPQFDAWRLRGEGPPQSTKAPHGSFDWMIGIYKAAPQYTSKPANTRKSYDAAARLVSEFVLKDGRKFGSLQLRSITPGAADKLFAKIKLREDGTERTRTAVLAMRVAQRAWGVAYRSQPTAVPFANPFAKMGLKHTPAQTRPVTHAELLKFVAGADAAGEPSIGTAAMIAFFWLQRQVDIVGRLAWTHYRPAGAPQTARIFHHKTGALIDMPLIDEHGDALWPELTARLDSATRHGTLIVTRDKPDKRKVHLPWQIDVFRHRVAEIREAAGIDSAVKFMGLRHGGNVEGANAGLTDAQLRALSGHKTTASLLRYAQETPTQRIEGAKKRRESRTKTGGRE